MQKINENSENGENAVNAENAEYGQNGWFLEAFQLPARVSQPERRKGAKAEVGGQNAPN